MPKLVLLYIKSFPAFSNAQVNRLSEVLANFGLMVIGTYALPIFFKTRPLDANMLIFGLAGGITLIVASLSVMKGIHS
jgi:hypothetical protein